MDDITFLLLDMVNREVVNYQMREFTTIENSYSVIIYLALKVLAQAYLLAV